MHNACVVALQIRDVPEDVRDALVAQAKARGQSLQAYLLELIETQARRLRNTAVLDRFAGRSMDPASCLAKQRPSWPSNESKLAPRDMPRDRPRRLRTVG